MAPSQSSLPAFLIGCHRSGTTLARYLLDSHPNLACPPESKFIAGLEAFLDYPQATAGILSLGFTWCDIYCEMRRLIEAFLGGYARQQGKSRWIDKTPNYYRILPLLDDIFAGEVLYLFLVRHPLDCIHSLDDTFWAATRFDGDPEIASAVERYGKGRYAWARYWTEVYERIATFAALHPDRCHLFQYENLVLHPEQTLTRLLAFLGETLPEGLVETALAREHTPGFQDYKIGDTRSIQTSGVGKWKSWPPSEAAALWALVDRVALRFGYEPPG